MIEKKQPASMVGPNAIAMRAAEIKGHMTGEASKIVGNRDLRDL